MSEAAGRRLRSGERIGRYDIVRFLAAGGMGELYLACSPDAKLVALKTIRSVLRGREAATKMFLDEARLAASLSHPNIVRVLDVGAEGADTFFAMEYVEGSDARDVLKTAAQESSAA